MKKVLLLSLIAGIFLVGAPVASHAAWFSANATCKTFSYSDYQINNAGKMSVFTLHDTPLYLDNATLAYDDDNGYLYGEIDMNTSTVYFSSHDGSSTGNLIVTTAGAYKAAVNCDVLIEHTYTDSYGTQWWYEYPGSAEVNIAVSSTGKAVFRIGSITANDAYWSDDDWYDTYQDNADVMYKATLPAISGWLN